MSAKYIKYFPKPFLEDLTEGHVFPIIGAGFSRNAKSDDGKPSLDWNELGEYFAGDIVDYKYSSPIDAISAFEYEYSRSKLIEKMFLALKIGSIHPDKAHKSFAKLPFQLVATTNFDYLLEESYSTTNHKFCRTIIDEEQLPIINNNPKHLNLLKIHGDLSHPSRLIATEEDYDSFLNKFPMIATYITNLFISKTVLFIGYSVDDTDIRQIFQMIKDRLGTLKRRAYTIRINASIQEVNRFSRRGINVINIPITSEKIDYNQVFSDIFQELENYWTNNIPINATEEESQIDIKLAKISKNPISRLCYFSIDNPSLPYYKTNVFPIFYDYGFTAVTADDFLDSNENHFARIQSLINISNICMADLTVSSKYVQQQLELVIKKLNNTDSDFELIVVKNSENNMTSSDFYEKIKNLKSINAEKIINRTHLINFDIEKNLIDVKALELILNKISNEIYQKFDLETQKLLRGKQFNLALITGYISFEKSIREHYKNNRFVQTKLYSMLLEDNIIDQEQANILNEARYIRNRIIHGDDDIKLSKEQVTKLLEVLKFVQDKISGKNS
jgi:hypothetical protein